MPRPGTMLYLISYDMPSTPAGDRRRARLARNLQGLGQRVQLSVFEIESPPEKLPRLLREWSDILCEKEDSVRIYALCASCHRQVRHLGRAAPVELNDPMVW